MTNLSLHKYAIVDLLSLADMLDKDYYDVIISLCQGAINSANKLRDLEDRHPTSQYIILCNNLISEILTCIEKRKEYFIPYIHELHEKNKTSHDCGNCSGKCNMLHELKLVELKESDTRVKDILSHLQMMSLPLHAETIYPDNYRLLRNQMILLENTLSDLLYLEETYLVPKISEAQKSINAHA